MGDDIEYSMHEDYDFLDIAMKYGDSFPETIRNIPMSNKAKLVRLLRRFQ